MWRYLFGSTTLHPTHSEAMKAPMKPMKALSKTVKAMAMKARAKARKAPMKARRAPMKAPKSVVKKPAESDREKTPTSRAQEEPPCQIAGIYRTYAIIHQPGATYNSAILLYTPTMFMEIGGKGAFVGDVSQVISIADSGKIEPSMVSGEGLTINQFSGDEQEITNDFILTEIDDGGSGAQYDGFVLARVTPLAPATLVITEPDLGRGFNTDCARRPIQLGKPLRPVCMETKRGDIICKFFVNSFDNNNRTLPISYTHLMASMPPDDVAKLRVRRLMCSDYSHKEKHMETLLKMHEALQ